MRERGDDARRHLFVAYDHQQPATGTDVSAKVPGALLPNGIVFDVVRGRDGLHHVGECSPHLRMAPEDLVVPGSCGQDDPSVPSVTNVRLYGEVHVAYRISNRIRVNL